MISWSCTSYHPPPRYQQNVASLALNTARKICLSKEVVAVSLLCDIAFLLSIVISMTHWERILAGYGTPLFGDLWLCRPPAVPAIPTPGSADWVFFQAPTLWAWRSDSRADWLPKKHKQQEQMSRGGATHSGVTAKCEGVHVFRLCTADSACWSTSEHICHTFCSVSLLLSSRFPHPLFPFVYLSRVGLSRLENQQYKYNSRYKHTHTCTHLYHTQNFWTEGVVCSKSFSLFQIT